MKKIFLAIICTTLFYACSKHCDSFPNKYRDFFPYEKGDVISFANESGNEIKIDIEEKHITQDHKLSWNCKCGCDIYMSFGGISTNKEFRIGGLFHDDGYVDLSISNIMFFTHQDPKVTDTLIFYPEKMYSDIKGTIKLVKGVGLGNLFIGEEEYSLKKK